MTTPKDKENEVIKEKSEKHEDELEKKQIEILISVMRKIWEDDLKKDINIVRKIIPGGSSDEDITNLTGATTLDKLFNIKEYKNFIKFKVNNYLSMVIQEYNYLEKQLKAGKIVSASFYHSRKNSLGSLNEVIIDLAKSIKFKNKEEIKNLLDILDVEPKKYLEWLKKHNIAALDSLSKLPLNTIIESILENLPYDTSINISKTKHGIMSKHSYIVTNAFEHGGYKYITFRNPHHIKSKIYYDKSTKLTDNIDLPKEILNKLDENEFIMELNHFFKYVDTIHYEL